mmetsp:Transcript_2894/g.6734  ORF Transcript_2894/g.6734 Transcript_2894/m.6734 type:complete len:457 (+) Transcript_2894:383-1753(+)|eukprot:CAMPEP_0171589880 /NCGR_PEP_ID=MMETSP0961-20121227/15160_1 /TAXON_ID=87120 /ORGANISM="Aurantiochytrium limacinum, Strain ATCCMYA-1381" /LENGTH=456 /DNA_ID=CAMNT_0012149359 /DNA_START=376 /DNA_END=1746 /DNA_ORIENTATION=+
MMMEGSAHDADSSLDTKTEVTENAEFSYNRRKLQNSQAARRFRAKRKEELKRMREEIATLKRGNAEAQRLLTEVRKFCFAQNISARDFPEIPAIENLLAAWEEDDRSHSDNDTSSRSVDAPTYQTQLSPQEMSPAYPCTPAPVPPVRLASGLGIVGNISNVNNINSINNGNSVQKTNTGDANLKGSVINLKTKNGNSSKNGNTNQHNDNNNSNNNAGAGAKNHAKNNFNHSNEGLGNDNGATKLRTNSGSQNQSVRSNSNGGKHVHVGHGGSITSPLLAASRQSSHGSHMGKDTGSDFSPEHSPLLLAGTSPQHMAHAKDNRIKVQQQGARVVDLQQQHQHTHQHQQSQENAPVGLIPGSGGSPLACVNVGGLTGQGLTSPVFDLLGLQGMQDANGFPSNMSSIFKQMASAPGSSSIIRLESKIADLEQRLLERIAELPEKFGNGSKRQRRTATSS